MNKLSQDNNNKRITDITKINTKINNINKDKDNLDAKITNNAKEKDRKHCNYISRGDGS